MLHVIRITIIVRMFHAWFIRDDNQHQILFVK